MQAPSGCPCFLSLSTKSLYSPSPILTPLPLPQSLAGDSNFLIVPSSLHFLSPPPPPQMTENKQTKIS